MPQVQKAETSAGRAAYDEDVRRHPRYHDGTARKSWEQLCAHERDTWERNPTARDYANTCPECGMAIPAAWHFCPPSSPDKTLPQE